jgi:hypothetical protein
MSTYNYLTPGEAFAASRDGVADWQTIIGLKGADADRVGLNNAARITRTRTGNARKPEETWVARGGMEKHGKVIVRVARTREETNDFEVPYSTVTVHYADGTWDYIHAGDLLCVERPIGA